MPRSPLTPIHFEQLHIVRKTKELRARTTELSSRIAKGHYTDADLEELYVLADTAPAILNITRQELAEFAGLGHNFFPTLLRDRRRPKLENFLRALVTITELASERLREVDAAEEASTKDASLRISTDYAELLLLASSLAQLAKEEIVKLEEERPNSPEAVLTNSRQQELLSIFADGFGRIARALTIVSRAPGEEIAIRKAAHVVESVGSEINVWWAKNKQEVVDWSIRIPTMAAGIALLGVAGAPATLATTVVAAMIGGEKVVTAIKRGGAKSQRKKKSSSSN